MKQSCRQCQHPGFLLGLLGQLLIKSLLLLLISTCAYAAGTSPKLVDYSHRVWTAHDGLPHNTILSIAQTQEGYLWLATWEGLARYNGSTFKVFDRNSQPALRDSATVVLHTGQKGVLWFADTRGNLGRWSPGNQIRYWGKPEGLPDAGIDGIFEAANGDVWITFNGLGLGRLTPTASQFKLIQPQNHTQNFVGIRPTLDRTGRLWVGSLQGLLYVEGNKLLPAPAAFNLPTGVAWPYQAPDGTIWIVAGNQLYQLNDTRLQHIHTLPPGLRVTALLQDHYGALWLGTENRGILRLSEHGLETVGAKMGLPEGRIASLIEDQEHNVWAATNGGLYRLREALFSTVGLQTGLSNAFVRTLAEDAQHTLWLGGSGGLDAMNPDGSIRHIPLQPSTDKQGDVSVLSLLADGHTLWVGTYGDGLYELRNGVSVRRYGRRDGLLSNHVRALARAADGSLWIGTRQGVFQLRDGVIQSLNTPGMPSTLIHALLDSGRALWIGAQSGLYRYADGSASKIPLGDAGEPIRALALYLNPTNRALWVSSDRGLWRLLNQKISHIGIEQGLPIDAVFQMAQDNDGSAWIGSNRGVLRLSYLQLREVANGTAPRINAEVFDNRDGMSNAQVNGGAGTSTLLTHDGRVWFATAEGAASVQPQRLLHYRTQSAPATVVEGLLVDGTDTPIPEQGSVNLPAGTRRIAITWAGLNFVSPQSIRYRTQLEGYDNAWTARGNQHLAEFTALGPGHYTFRVEASIGDHGSMGQAAVLHFQIEPFWWQRTTVQTIALLVLLLAIWFIYRLRMRSYHRNAERLELLVGERTSDLQRQTLALQHANEEKSTLAERLREQAELFERQAYQDALTGLPNRRAFDTVLAREFANAHRNNQPLCFVALDIDHFKRINDTYSHAIGDLVLKTVGQLLQNVARESDFAARVGGEEFAVLLNDDRIEDAQTMCERLRENFHATQNWADIEGLQVTFSAGLVRLSTGDANPQQLMDRADAALYQAKRDGRDRICTA